MTKKTVKKQRDFKCQFCGKTVQYGENLTKQMQNGLYKPTCFDCVINDIQKRFV